MSKKIALAIIVAVVTCFLLFAPIIPVSVEYKETEPVEVPVEYEYSAEWGSTLLGLDWELYCEVVVENVDDEGGPFTVTVYFYDGDNLAYKDSDTKYIAPGQEATFTLYSSGLSYSTDWETRYHVTVDIDPPKKIEYRVVSRYKTKYISLIQLLFQQES